MQLIPETALRFKVKNPFNAEQNIRGGLAYLRWLKVYFRGDMVRVIAAYNAGEKAVDKYQGIPPYYETQVYVRRVLYFAGMRLHTLSPKGKSAESAQNKLWPNLSVVR
jgi:soluble lytic murein transglycosylase-like protein